MTEWIVDPDPTTLRIGQECEAQYEESPAWYPAKLYGHNWTEDEDEPWFVRRDEDDYDDCPFYRWAAHIRIKKPERTAHFHDCAKAINSRHDCTCGDGVDESEPQDEKPYALVPLTMEDAERLREIAGKIFVNNSDTTYQLELADSIEARMPKRPEIAVDEPVWVKDDTTYEWIPGHFAGWSDDMKPYCWGNGNTSHSSPNGHKLKWRIIKTKDGTVWPPE